MIRTLGELKVTYTGLGDWRGVADVNRRGAQRLAAMAPGPAERLRLYGRVPHAALWSGQYARGTRDAQLGLDSATELEDRDHQASACRDLGLGLGLQGRYEEGYARIRESIDRYTALGEEYRFVKATAYAYWGFLLAREGRLEEAEERLSRALQTFDRAGIEEYETITWMGQLCELQARLADDPAPLLEQAATHYRRTLSGRRLGSRYLRATALVGLLRTGHGSEEMPQEALTLATDQGYADHLASLHLLMGHAALDSADLAEAQSHYRQALRHALAYNRFRLDEVLSGGGSCTPDLPILARASQLSAGLLTWWEGAGLAEPEAEARQREPGDGRPQATVAEQLRSALQP